MYSKVWCVAVMALMAAAGPAIGQTTFRQLPISNENYVKPFPPVRIVDSLYYVGTYDLAVYLI